MRGKGGRRRKLGKREMWALKKRLGFDFSGSCLRREGNRIFEKWEEKGKGKRMEASIEREGEGEGETERGELLSRVSSCEEVTVNTRQGGWWGVGPTLLLLCFQFFFLCFLFLLRSS